MSLIVPPEIFRKTDTFFKKLDAGEGSTLVAAVSGGGDSLALLFLTNFWSRVYRWNIVAAYFDHGLRSAEERSEEQALLGRHCRHLKIPLEKESRAPDEHRSPGESPEAFYRKIRYRFLQKVSRKYGASAVATGHHRDDQTETLLMHFFQSGLWGNLKGIPEKRGRMIRPLLRVSRKEIEEFLEKNALSFSRDSSNDKDIFLRNKLRKYLIPELKKIFPGFEKNLLRNYDLQRDEESFLPCPGDPAGGKKGASLPARGLRWEKRGDLREIEESVFTAASARERLESLYRVFSEIRSSRGDCSEKPYRLPVRFLAPLLRRRLSVGEFSSLRGHGIFLYRNAKKLCCREASATGETGKEGFCFLFSPEKEVFFDLSRFGTPGDLINQEKIYIINKRDLSPPCRLRNAESGDAVRLKNKQVRIKQLIHSWGIPEKFRHRIPVLEDRRGLAAVWGGAFRGADVAADGVSVREAGNFEENTVKIRLIL